MCIKINRNEFNINETVVSDTLIFMLHAYHSKDYKRFLFWRRQFNKAIQVDEECYCDEVIIESHD